MRRREMPGEFEIVLDLASLAGTEHARRLLGAVRDSVRGEEDVAPWARAVQLARDVGALDHDAAFFLLDILTEQAAGAFLDTDETLASIMAMIEAAEAREGLGPGESFFVGEGPPDWEALQRAWDARFAVLRAAVFVRLREAGMAMLLWHDIERYDERSRAGWRALVALTEEGMGPEWPA